MKEILAKLKSRKLWAAVVGLWAGLAVVFGVDGNAVSTVAGAIVSALSVATYIVTEGRIDAAALSQPIPELQEVIALLSDEKEMK